MFGGIAQAGVNLSLGLPTTIFGIINQTRERVREDEKFEENKRQYETSLAEQIRQYNTSRQDALDIINWQKQENELTRQREDTAIQRQMKDLEAAGINPLMAANMSGAGYSAGGVVNPPVANYTPQIATAAGGPTHGNIANLQISGLEAIDQYLEAKRGREFSASEAEKDRKLKAEALDIERFNAETKRMQEENSEEYNKLKAKLEQQGLEQREKEFLATQKNFYDQMISDSQKFAEQISVEKRKAKTMEDRQALEELNSEVQRSLTTMQKLAISNEMTNEEKKIKLQEEKQTLEAKFAKSANRREWMNSIWGNINKSIDSITSGVAKFLPGKGKK